MITVTVRWGDNYADIEFPCTDSELQSKLEQLHPAAPHSDSIFILSVQEPTALSVLEDQFLDLDELNYLAKRMDSFDMNELFQFYAAAHHESYHEPKDLINLTFNLPCYTVIQNLSSMEAVGKAHYLTIHGAMSREEQRRTDFAAIGRELIRSGKGRATEFGLLFRNDEIPFEEVYDGTVFPDYDYSGDSLVTAAAQYNGKTEYLYLPCDSLAITKAMYRLGAGSVSDLSFTLEDIGTNSPAWFDRLKQILSDEGIYEANSVVESINSADMNLDKLTAVIAYAGRTDAASIVAIAERMDDFVFIPGAVDESDVSHYFLDHNSEYTLHPDLEDFFDHQRFGEHLAAEYDGRFTDGGFVCMNDNCTLEEILRPVDEESITLGGM